MIRTIEIYDERFHAVGTRKVRGCTGNKRDDDLGYKKFQKFCRSMKYNEMYHQWDWAPQYDK